MKPSNAELEKLHLEAEASITPYSYKKPVGIKTGKGLVRLTNSALIKGAVQVLQSKGGENNLHYHANVDTFWMVLAGKVKFYGPDDTLIGEYGPKEGLITPRFSRYWFENSGEEEAELLQVAAKIAPNSDSGREDVSERKFAIGTAEKFSAEKSTA